jgi:shikimate kinase
MPPLNIVLIGCRCSGKTQVGKILAEALNLGFSDLDQLIESHAGCSIDEVVSREGWARFRALEKCITETVSRREHLVIATGGGVVMNRENVESLKRKGWIVWLKGDPHVLRKRMLKEQRQGNNRPSLTGLDPLEEIEKVLTLRNPLYEQAADMVLDTGALSEKEVAGFIADTFSEGVWEREYGR